MELEKNSVRKREKKPAQEKETKRKGELGKLKRQKASSYVLGF